MAENIPTLKLPVRFFVVAFNDDGEHTDIDTCEVDEDEFMQAEGVIEYECHTVFEHGVSQICLTKNPHKG